MDKPIKSEETNIKEPEFKKITPTNDEEIEKIIQESKPILTTKQKYSKNYHMTNKQLLEKVHEMEGKITTIQNEKEMNKSSKIPIEKIVEETIAEEKSTEDIIKPKKQSKKRPISPVKDYESEEKSEDSDFDSEEITEEEIKKYLKQRQKNKKRQPKTNMIQLTTDQYEQLIQRTKPEKTPIHERASMRPIPYLGNSNIFL